MFLKVSHTRFRASSKAMISTVSVADATISHRRKGAGSVAQPAKKAERQRQQLERDGHNLLPVPDSNNDPEGDHGA